MYNSIPGILNAFDVIQKANVTTSNTQTTNNSSKEKKDMPVKDISKNNQSKGKNKNLKNKNPQHQKKSFNTEEFDFDDETKRKLLVQNQSINQYYSEIENCTSRIQAKLREIDHIDNIISKQVVDSSKESLSILKDTTSNNNNNNENILVSNDTQDAITVRDEKIQRDNNNNDNDDDNDQYNENRMFSSQCLRAQTLLSSQYYLSHLHTSDILTSISEVDEHISMSARNFKFSLLDYGIEEHLLNETTGPSIDVPDTKTTDKTIVDTASIKNTNRDKTTVSTVNQQPRDSRVRRNSALLQERGSLITSGGRHIKYTSEYNDYTDAELEELKQLVAGFMDKQFLNGTNSYTISAEMSHKCNVLKEKMFTMTSAIIEEKRDALKDVINQMLYKVRSYENDISMFRTQIDEIELEIKAQYDNDRDVRKLVEEQYRESIYQMNEHVKRLDTKRKEQHEINVILQKRRFQMQEMIEELYAKHINADPFVRRRAENLVKGLLKDLDAATMKVQELREQDMMNNYVQWKDIQQDITTKKHQILFLEKQEATRIEEYNNEEQRIQADLTMNRDKARKLRETNEALVEKLDKIEASIFERAREVRKKTLLMNKISGSKNTLDEKGKGERSSSLSGAHLITKDGLDLTSNETFVKSLERKYTVQLDSTTSSAILSNQITGSSSKDIRAQRYQRKLLPTNATNAIEDMGGNNSDSSSTDEDHDRNQQDSHKSHKFHRIKQKSIRMHTDPLCDPQTEAILNTTLDHIKRQEITSTVDHHMPLSAYSEMHSITGSAELDNELRKKARAAINALNKHKLSITIEEGKELVDYPDYDHRSNGGGGGGQRRASLMKGSLSQGSGQYGSGIASKTKSSLWNIQDSSSDTDQENNHRHNDSTVHSFSCTAGYFTLHQRYLQKFPNLKVPINSKSNLITANHPSSTFQFTITEGIYVVREVIDTLLSVECITKDFVKEHIDKLAFLERLEGLSNLREEAAEVRFQLHFTCVNLIHQILLKAPQVLLVKNDRKSYVDIILCILSLLGVVMNCVLVFWPGLKNAGLHYSPTGFKGMVDDDRIEYISCKMLELLITQGNLPDPSANKRRSTYKNDTRRSKKPVVQVPTPEEFISLLHKKIDELMSIDESKTAMVYRTIPTSSTVDTTSKQSTSSIHNCRDLFTLLQEVIQSNDNHSNSSSDQNSTYAYTMNDRHELLAIQLFLYVTMNNQEIKIEDAILMMQKGLLDGNQLVRSTDLLSLPYLPCDVDVLLQSMNTQMIPVVLVLELLRRIIEEEFHRKEFLNRIATSKDPEVLDLQYLNVSQSTEFDVELRRISVQHMQELQRQQDYKDKKKKELQNNSMSTGALASEQLLLEQQQEEDINAMVASMTTIEPIAPPIVDHTNSSTSIENTNINSNNIEENQLTGTIGKKGIFFRYSTTKEVHQKWLWEMEQYFLATCSKIRSILIPKPEEYFSIGNNVVLDLMHAPLPNRVSKRLLIFLERIQSIVAAHSVSGEDLILSMQPEFRKCMQETNHARKAIYKILNVVTWPLHKKNKWLKQKHDILVEECKEANEEIEDYYNQMNDCREETRLLLETTMKIKHEKSDVFYQRTKTLILTHHEPRVQAIMMDHATEEYTQKLQEILVREEHFHGVIQQLESKLKSLDDEMNLLVLHAQAAAIAAAGGSTRASNIVNGTMANGMMDEAGYNIDPTQRGTIITNDISSRKRLNDTNNFPSKTSSLYNNSNDPRGSMSGVSTYLSNNNEVIYAPSPSVLAPNNMNEDTSARSKDPVELVRKITELLRDPLSFTRRSTVSRTSFTQSRKNTTLANYLSELNIFPPDLSSSILSQQLQHPQQYLQQANYQQNSNLQYPNFIEQNNFSHQQLQQQQQSLIEAYESLPDNINNNNNVFQINYYPRKYQPPIPTSYQSLQSMKASAALKRSYMRAKAAEMAAEKNVRLPILGATFKRMKKTEMHSVPGKQFGFSNRIEDGLQPVHLFNDDSSSGDDNSDGSDEDPLRKSIKNVVVDLRRNSNKEASYLSIQSNSLDLSVGSSTISDNEHSTSDDMSYRDRKYFFLPRQQRQLSKIPKKNRISSRKTTISKRNIEQVDETKVNELAGATVGLDRVSPYSSSIGNNNDWIDGKTDHYYSNIFLGPTTKQPSSRQSSIQAIAATAKGKKTMILKKPQWENSEDKRRSFMNAIQREKPFKYEDLVFAYQAAEEGNVIPLSVKDYLITMWREKVKQQELLEEQELQQQLNKQQGQEHGQHKEDSTYSISEGTTNQNYSNRSIERKEETAADLLFPLSTFDSTSFPVEEEQVDLNESMDKFPRDDREELLFEDDSSLHNSLKAIDDVIKELANSYQGNRRRIIPSHAMIQLRKKRDGLIQIEHSGGTADIIDSIIPDPTQNNSNDVVNEIQSQETEEVENESLSEIQTTMKGTTEVDEMLLNPETLKAINQVLTMNKNLLLQSMKQRRRLSTIYSHNHSISSRLAIDAKKEAALTSIPTGIERNNIHSLLILHSNYNKSNIMDDNGFEQGQVSMAGRNPFRAGSLLKYPVRPHPATIIGTMRSSFQHATASSMNKAGDHSPRLRSTLQYTISKFNRASSNKRLRKSTIRGKGMLSDYELELIELLQKNREMSISARLIDENLDIDFAKKTETFMNRDNIFLSDITNNHEDIIQKNSFLDYSSSIVSNTDQNVNQIQREYKELMSVLSRLSIKEMKSIRITQKIQDVKFRATMQRDRGVVGGQNVSAIAALVAKHKNEMPAMIKEEEEYSNEGSDNEDGDDGDDLATDDNDNDATRSQDNNNDNDANRSQDNDNIANIDNIHINHNSNMVNNNDIIITTTNSSSTTTSSNNNEIQEEGITITTTPHPPADDVRPSYLSPNKRRNILNSHNH